MKIERISENQIRCTLTSLDLSARNLNLAELAYGSEKARNLFREMIQKASNEVGFEAEDIPLMVEAIPLPSESVMLVITKIEDPEELDTRFSKFAPLSEEDQELLGGIAKDILEGADGLLDFLKKDVFGISEDANEATFTDDMDVLASEQESDADASEPAAPPIHTRIFRFDCLDRISEAAKVTALICPCTNILYKNPVSGRYYLVLSSADTDARAFSRLCNMLSEYGDKVKAEAGSEAYYREHYEVIVRSETLQKLALL